MFWQILEQLGTRRPRRISHSQAEWRANVIHDSQKSGAKWVVFSTTYMTASLTIPHFFRAPFFSVLLPVFNEISTKGIPGSSIHVPGRPFRSSYPYVCSRSRIDCGCTLVNLKAQDCGAYLASHPDDAWG